MKIKLFLLFNFCSILACNFQNEEQLKDVDFSSVKFQDRYSIEIPKYLPKTSFRSAGCDLNYLDIQKQFNVRTITGFKHVEKKAIEQLPAYNKNLSLIDNYISLQKQRTFNSVNLEKDYGIEKRNIHGKNARILNYTEKLPSSDILHHTFTVIEVEDYIYMIDISVLQKDFEYYFKTINHIIDSFKEL